MRTFERVRDVLEHSQAFHRQIGELYDRLEEVADKERVKMLLEYMGRHERHLSRSLARYEAEASHLVLDSWFKYTLDDDPAEWLSGVKLSEDMTVDQVITLALRLDDYFVKLYRNLADQSRVPEVREVFSNLLELEQREECRLARNALLLQDI